MPCPLLAPHILPMTPRPKPTLDLRGAVWRWTRILLARNPFYIISAMLLLWPQNSVGLVGQAAF